MSGNCWLVIRLGSQTALIQRSRHNFADVWRAHASCWTFGFKLPHPGCVARPATCWSLHTCSGQQKMKWLMLTDTHRQTLSSSPDIPAITIPALIHKRGYFLLGRQNIFLQVKRAWCYIDALHINSVVRRASNGDNSARNRRWPLTFPRQSEIYQTTLRSILWA